MKFKKRFIVFLFLFIVVGCSTNKFTFYYNSEGLSKNDYIPLKENERILLIETHNLEQKLNEYKNKGYVLIGSSVFEGVWYPQYHALKTAKEKGASVILLFSVHQGDVKQQYVIPYQRANTVYHHGNISSNYYTSGSVNAYDGMNYLGRANYNSSTYGSSTYSGTSTYYTTEYLHGSYKTSYYKQTALFLAKKR